MQLLRVKGYILKLCIATSLIATSCTATHKTAYEERTEPKFLEGITLSGNKKNNITLKGKNNPLGEDNGPILCNSIQNKYAAILKVIPETITNSMLYNFIEEWYGVPYRLGGNDKSGIDCSALVQRLYEQVFHTNLVRTAFEQFNFCRMIWDTSELKEGDLVFFRIHSRRISHVGIYLMNNFFVHASSSQGVMISNLSDSYWKRYFAGAGEIPKNAEVN